MIEICPAKRENISVLSDSRNVLLLDSRLRGNDGTNGLFRLKVCMDMLGRFYLNITGNITRRDFIWQDNVLSNSISQLNIEMYIHMPIAMKLLNIQHSYCRFER